MLAILLAALMILIGGIVAAIVLPATTSCPRGAAIMKVVEHDGRAVTACIRRARAPVPVFPLPVSRNDLLAWRVVIAAAGALLAFALILMWKRSRPAERRAVSEMSGIPKGP